jgi:protein-tyrosine-phosphatase
MKILFICKYNVFRSKIAESYFKKINKNKNINATSAGFIDGGVADKTQKSVAKKLLGVEIKGKIKHLSLDLIREQDLVVVVAKDVPRIMFNHSEGYGNAKFVYWGIKDEQLENRKNVEKIVKKIGKKVDELVKKLK